MAETKTRKPRAKKEVETAFNTKNKEVINNVDETNNTVENIAPENKDMVNNIEDALNKVETTIATENIEINEPDTTVFEQITEKINEVEKAQKELNEKIENEPEKAEEIIQEEMKKAEDLKEEVKTIIKNNNITYTWNGMYMDY